MCLVPICQTKVNKYPSPVGNIGLFTVINLTVFSLGVTYMTWGLCTVPGSAGFFGKSSGTRLMRQGPLLVESLEDSRSEASVVT